MNTKKDIEFLKIIFQKLESEFGLQALEDEIDKDTESVYMPFPREEEIEIEIDELLRYFDAFDSIKIHNTNKVTTDTITQRVVTCSDLTPFYYLGHFFNETGDGIQISIRDNPILIGIAAIKMSEYSKYYPPCSSHIAVEIRYPTKEKRLSDESETKLITAFFFELAHTYKISFTFSTFETPDEYEEEELLAEHNILPKVLEEYNPGMELFVMANQTLTPELRFLTYYKVFEYFAPIYSKIDSFEAMRKKLDSSNANNLNATYIGSIFDLAKSYENSLRDKELVKAVINTTFDLIDIYSYLPPTIKKHLKTEKLDYKVKKETLDQIVNYLGNLLYSTRNAIVHTKSNYTPTGLECKTDELEELNEFMHKACYSTIKWYNRLPKHLKIT